MAARYASGPAVSYTTLWDTIEDRHEETRENATFGRRPSAWNRWISRVAHARGRRKLGLAAVKPLREAVRAP